MSYQQEIFSLIAQLGGSKNKVIVDRTLCQFMGSLERGVFLSQLLFWADKGRGGAWFYKSYKEWNDETFLSEYQVRQGAKACAEMGFLETDLRKANGSPTVHYKIDHDKFLDSILKFLRIHSEIFKNPNLNSSESIPENFSIDPAILQKPLTEITSEITPDVSDDGNDKGVPAPPTETEMLIKSWEAETKKETTPLVAKKIGTLVEEYGAGAVEHGIGAAVEHGNVNLAYVAKCAKNFGKVKPERPPPKHRSNGHAKSAADERRNYRPEEYSDVILG